MESLAWVQGMVTSSTRRMTCEVTLIARPDSRPTLGRLRVLATMKSRTVVVTIPETPVETPRHLEVTRWSQLIR